MSNTSLSGGGSNNSSGSGNLRQRGTTTPISKTSRTERTNQQQQASNWEGGRYNDTSSTSYGAAVTGYGGATSNPQQQPQESSLDQQSNASFTSIDLGYQQQQQEQSYSYQQQQPYQQQQQSYSHQQQQPYQQQHQQSSTSGMPQQQQQQATNSNFYSNSYQQQPHQVTYQQQPLPPPPLGYQKSQQPPQNSYSNVNTAASNFFQKPVPPIATTTVLSSPRQRLKTKAQSPAVVSAVRSTPPGAKNIPPTNSGNSTRSISSGSSNRSLGGGGYQQQRFNATATSMQQRQHQHPTSPMRSKVKADAAVDALLMNHHTVFRRPLHVTDEQYAKYIQTGMQPSIYSNSNSSSLFNKRTVASICSVFAFVGFFFLLFIGILLDTQPLYIAGTLPELSIQSTVTRHDSKVMKSKSQFLIPGANEPRLTTAVAAYRASFLYLLVFLISLHVLDPTRVYRVYNRLARRYKSSKYYSSNHIKKYDRYDTIANSDTHNNNNTINIGYGGGGGGGMNSTGNNHRRRRRKAFTPATVLTSTNNNYEEIPDVLLHQRNATIRSGSYSDDNEDDDDHSTDENITDYESMDGGGYGSYQQQQQQQDGVFQQISGSVQRYLTIRGFFRRKKRNSRYTRNSTGESVAVRRDE